MIHQLLGLGYKGISKKPYFKKLLGLLSLTRPLFTIMTPINAASAAILAYGKLPPLGMSLLGLVTVGFAGAGVNIFNDYIDRDRDKAIWPERAIPAGRIRPGEALALALASYLISLILCYHFFPPFCFTILFSAIVLGSLYSTHARDRVGYLTLPPINGLIYLGGWSAFAAPESLISNPLPWLLYGLGLCWQAAHILFYVPLHHTEGPSPFDFAQGRFHSKFKGSVRMGFLFFLTTIGLSLLLLPFARLGLLYLIFLIPFTMVTFTLIIKFLNRLDDRGWGINTFFSLSLYRLALSLGIIAEVILHRGI